MTSGTSRLRPVSVRSRTMSGNTAMKFRDSSLLTAVPTMAGGTGGVRATLMHLCDREKTTTRLGERRSAGPQSVRVAAARRTYLFPWTATARRWCGYDVALRHSGPANESILFIAARAIHDAVGTMGNGTTGSWCPTGTADATDVPRSTTRVRRRVSPAGEIERRPRAHPTFPLFHYLLRSLLVFSSRETCAVRPPTGTY